jgi:hypothetical protein
MITMGLNRHQKRNLAGRKNWCVSADQEFAAKAADIVGLYLAPLLFCPLMRSPLFKPLSVLKGI